MGNVVQQFKNNRIHLLNAIDEIRFKT